MNKHYALLLLSVSFFGPLCAKQEVKKASTEVASLAKKSVKNTIEKKAEKPKKQKKAPLKTVNKIAIIVYTDDEPIVITMHDITRKTLDGRKQTKDEVLMDRLIFYEATHTFRMPIPEDRVEKHLLSIKEYHGISEDDIKVLFKREGYSFEEGKEQLRISYTIQTLLQSLIGSRLVVTEKEIKDYYDKHPIKVPATFRIKKAEFSADDMTPEEIKELEQKGEYQERLVWGTSYTLEKDEIADSKKFITKMKPGAIKVVKTDDGYEAIKLIKWQEARTLTLDESRHQIADILRGPKYEQMLDEFKQSLLDKYEIVDLT